MKALIGKKIGMTRIFDKESKSIPVTAIQAGPCPIIKIQKKRVHIGFENLKKAKKSKKMFFHDLNHKPLRYVKTFKISENEVSKLSDKTQITVNDFKIGQKINVSGVSKGKGFSGVIKRHSFHGMPASHGHEKQRIPGSIGCQFPQRVIKGKKMAGQMGNKKITVKNLQIVDIDRDNNIILLKGSTPSCIGKILFISQTKL